MIISLLDNDYYAFTMANAIHKAGDSELPVRYQFRNRNFAVPLASRINLTHLRDEINKIRSLNFYPLEIEFLRKQGIFSDDWLKTLEWGFTLPEVEVGNDNGHLTMSYEGSWGEAIFWESMLLATVNELYYSQFPPYFEEGRRRLNEKIDYLKERGTLHFAEFGTRRRYSGVWQHHVTHLLKDEVPELMVGTSNVKMARDLDLKPVGTMAHQLFMVYAATHMTYGPGNKPTILHRGGRPDTIEAATNEVLRIWLSAYSGFPHMLTVLPDTYTTKAFIQRVDPTLLSAFYGVRQDSGDPIAIGEKLCLMGKKLMFSDGLDVRKMSVIEDHFPDMQMVFGWGTDLTNDLGYQALPIVIKPCAVKLGDDDWEPCVKLSDDPQKVTGANDATRPYLEMIQ